MKQLIFKYSILLIVASVIARLFTAFIIIQWPELLTTENLDGSTTSYSYGLLESVLEYLINLVFIILIKKDLDKQEMKSAPLLILTFFSSIIGVVFFLLISVQNKLTYKRQTI